MDFSHYKIGQFSGGQLSRLNGEFPGHTYSGSYSWISKFMITLHKTTLQLSALLLCCIFSSQIQAQGNTSDPWEKLNRPLFELNRLLDEYLIRPVSGTYAHYTPQPVKRGVSNFFNNIDDINVVVNDMLQWKLQQAKQDSARLLLNTTIGLGGVIDVASSMGLHKHYEDFGQTFGVWGFGNGAYMMLPLFGASTVRDTAGLVADMFFNPISWIDERDTRTAFYAMDMVDTRISYMDAESLIRGDRYQFIRTAYLQRREYLVADGQVKDEFDDF